MAVLENIMAQFYINMTTDQSGCIFGDLTRASRMVAVPSVVKFDGGLMLSDFICVTALTNKRTRIILISKCWIYEWQI
jgi:hypothetical protein